MALRGKNRFELAKIYIRALPIIFGKCRPWEEALVKSQNLKIKKYDVIWPKNSLQIERSRVRISLIPNIFASDSGPRQHGSDAGI